MLAASHCSSRSGRRALRDGSPHGPSFLRDPRLFSNTIPSSKCSASPISDLGVLHRTVQCPIRRASFTMSKATELVAGAAVQAAEHGRHIFIYNNVRTNQVVYSLYRSMHVCLSSITLYMAIKIADALPRTTLSSARSPSSARNPSRPPSVKTSGGPLQPSPSLPTTKASPPTANCANSAKCTSLPGRRKMRRSCRKRRSA